MADEEKKAKSLLDGAAAAKDKTKDEDGLGDDLFDLFTEDDVVNEQLALLTASLEEIDIYDLLEQVRELQDIMNERR